jgi:hypothetical protein
MASTMLGKLSMGVVIKTDFESMAKWWSNDKKFQCVKMYALAVLWSLWKT